MRPADPVHNVELRLNHHGQESVVFAFPYRADIVDAVRAIPGRRFDWEAKEWWAPRADATAPYVKGVLEQHPALSVVAARCEAWLAKAVRGWVGRVTAGQAIGRRALRAREDLRRAARGARRRGRRRRRPRLGAVLPGGGGRAARRCRAPGSTRGRCAARRGCRSTRTRRRRRCRWSRASASRASRSTSTGTRRRSRRSSRCPPARRTAGRCRSTRTCWSRSSTTCARTTSSCRRPRATSWTACGASTTRRSTASAARAPTTRRSSTIEDRLGGELRPFQRAGRGLRARGAAHVPGRRAGPRQDRAGAGDASRPTTPTRPSSCARRR